MNKTLNNGLEIYIDDYSTIINGIYIDENVFDDDNIEYKIVHVETAKKNLIEDLNCTTDFLERKLINKAIDFLSLIGSDFVLSHRFGFDFVNIETADFVGEQTIEDYFTYILEKHYSLHS